MDKPNTPVPLPAPRQHHKYGPSKMGYLAKCAAFTGKEGESDAAEEGTALHDFIEGMVAQVINKKSPTVLEQVPGVVKKHELSDDQDSALRFAARKMDKFFALKPSKVLTEIDVKIERLNGKNLNHGFLDVLFIFNNTVGVIVDYKFGKLPVPSAPRNHQGKNYWVGVMQKYPGLTKCGVCFVQPRLNYISEAMFSRNELPGILKELETIANNADAVQRDPKNSQHLMAVGKYCDWCALSGDCAVLNNHRGMAVATHQGLALPPKFDGLTIDNPSQLALARYWVDVIEQGLGDVKKKAVEAAEANGGEISCTLPSGEVVTYAMAERGHDRVLGAAADIADALKEFVTPEEILGAAELAIGKLQTVVKSAMVDMAKAKGKKLTNKDAWEQAEAVLTANDLLTKPGGTIRYLRIKRQTDEQKQLTEGKQ